MTQQSKDAPLTLAQYLYPHLRGNEKKPGTGPQGTAPTSIASGIYSHLVKASEPAPQKGNSLDQLRDYYENWRK